MQKQIAKWDTVNSDLAEFQDLLFNAIRAGGLESTDREFIGAPEIFVRDTEGNEIAEVKLMQETLGDGSYVYIVVLRFSNVE